MKRLQGSILQIENLTSGQTDRMFELMQESFEGIDRSTFLADLEEKDWAILLVDQVERIVGFSTQMLMSASVGGENIRAVFSGDTIIDRDSRGGTELMRAWGRLALWLSDRYAEEPLYWFLISMGYKTYRFLPIFFQEFYPRHDNPTPMREQAVLDALAIAKYGDAYDHTRGVIRLPGNATRLRPGVADLDAWRRTDRHIAFFEQRNPGHLRGEELVCMARLSRDNLRSKAHAIIERPGRLPLEL